MSIRVTCPNCEKSFSTSEANAGKKARCGGCQAVLVIPEPEVNGYGLEEPPSSPGFVHPSDQPTDDFPEEPPVKASVVVTGHPDDSPRSVRLVPTPHEPWFYRYLVIYALVLAGLAIFQFVIVTLFILYVYFTTTPNPHSPPGRFMRRSSHRCSSRSCS